MFSKKQEPTSPQYEKFETLIGKSTLVEGTVKSEEPLRIDGTIRGGVICKADLIIGEKGNVYGDVQCLNLMLAGKIEGNVEASGQLHITASGSLKGDASIRSFIVDERGIFDGKCHMVTESAEQSGENSVALESLSQSEDSGYQKGSSRRKR